jgi:predicted transposase/invertase (TIGR01784 family)
MGSTHIRFDWAIKRLLRQKANFGILEGFLSELLRQDVTIVEILESESNKDSLDDKLNRVDILAKIDAGELVIIEVQNERQHDYFHRMNFSQAKLITQYLFEADKYKDVKRIISVNIVYFELGQGNDYVYEGHTEFRGIHSNELLTLSGSQIKMFPYLNSVSEIFARYYIIKVNVFNDVAKDPLDEWIYFLKNSEIKDSFVAKGIREAKEKMRKDDLQGSEKEAYEQYVKEQRIKEAEIESALVDVEVKYNKQLKEIEAEIERERAEKEKEIAEKEKAIQSIITTIKHLGSMNMAAEQISAITGQELGFINEILKT